jgi:hypothetical protein
MTCISTDSHLDRLRRALVDGDAGEAPAAALERLIRLGLDRLPLPGRGQTLLRWQSLATVAEHDLSLAKLYEGHTDALAIWNECTGQEPDLSGAWGTWAAEAPPDRLRIVSELNANGLVTLTGRKRWCSGAATARHALATAWHDDDRRPQLVHIDLSQPAIVVDRGAWASRGMAGSPALDVRIVGALARPVGEPAQYLTRPGFWHGGAGVAACWFGGSLAIARALTRTMEESARPPDALRSAALGRVDMHLRATASLLREVAHAIDAQPDADAHAACLRARLAAETCATRVLDEVGRTLGAAPFCLDAHFARMAADLPVFIRQSHADRDFANLGIALQGQGGPAWHL